jgi:response regulator NasT
MLTAFSQREIVAQARDAGAMAYLVKPFQKADLVPAIELATSRYAETKALVAEVGELQERLEARKVLDRAKGLLIDQHGMKEAAAFSFIQQTAMAGRLTMRSVAESVLKGETVPNS